MSTVSCRLFVELRWQLVQRSDNAILLNGKTEGLEEVMNIAPREAEAVLLKQEFDALMRAAESYLASLSGLKELSEAELKQTRKFYSEPSFRSESQLKAGKKLSDRIIGFGNRLVIEMRRSPLLNSADENLP